MKTINKNLIIVVILFLVIIAWSLLPDQKDNGDDNSISTTGEQQNKDSQSLLTKEGIKGLFKNKELVEEVKVNKFASLKELEKFIKDNQVSSANKYYLGAPSMGGMDRMSVAESDSSVVSGQESARAESFSTTNIQVEGVDEADIVKNDGKYIYVVSGNKVVIVDAYPAQNMKILSETEFKSNVNVLDIFINGNKLVVFTTDYSPILYGSVRCMSVEGCFAPQEQKTSVYIYDISDKQNPRMIGDYVYVIANQYVYQNIILPMILENKEINVVKPEEISYSPIRDNDFQFTIILGINVNNGNTTEEVMLTGSSHNIFVSENNIYTTYTKSQMWYPREIKTENQEKTIISKISVNKDKIKYEADGEVLGHVLNQFSMDEYNGNFRIATTIGQSWGSDSPSSNNLYVLNNQLEVIGELEKMAPGESIYSVRFMGDRAYIVTFKKIDPLFVIDLSNPEEPSILGKLKIPGYSDYLHPYDKNHIIGIGKEAVDASIETEMPVAFVQNDFAWYQGVKMAIFDVTDVSNPVEMHKVVIGDRGTDSEALQNHKAFLFDKTKELLVLPITLAEIKGGKTSDNQYGEQTFQGAYVYKINLSEGFKLKGRVSHIRAEEELKSGNYYDWQTRVKRSLFMNNTLYTLSDLRLKANNLSDLSEIKFLEFGPIDSYNLYRDGELIEIME